MNEPILTLALEDLREARDRILRANGVLKNAGVNR
jgi:hypothetical protein